MVWIRIFSVIVWAIASFLLAFSVWVGLPIATAGKVMLGYSVIYVLVRLFTEAVEAIDLALRRRLRAKTGRQI